MFFYFCLSIYLLSIDKSDMFQIIFGVEGEKRMEQQEAEEAAGLCICTNQNVFPYSRLGKKRMKNVSLLT